MPLSLTRRSMSNWTRKILLASIALLCHIPMALASPLADDAALLEVLREGYRGVQENRSDISVVYDRTSRVAPELAAELGLVGGGDFTRAVRCRYLARGGRERVESGLEEGRPKGLFIYDGCLLLTFTSTAGTIDTETQVGRATRVARDTELLDSDYGPARLYGFHKMMPADVLYSDEAVLEREPYDLNGISAYKVTTPIIYDGITYTVSYWFSAQKSGLPVRFELHDPQGTFFKRLDVEEFLQLSDGSWFPKETVLREFSLVDGSMKERTAHRLVVEEVVLNPSGLDESLFSTSTDLLPTGTHVVDTVTDMRYVVGEGLLSEESMDKYIAQMLDEIDLTPTSSSAVATEEPVLESELLADEGIRRTQDPQRGTSLWKWGALCLGAAGVALAVVLVVRRGRQ